MSSSSLPFTLTPPATLWGSAADADSEGTEPPPGDEFADILQENVPAGFEDFVVAAGPLLGFLLGVVVSMAFALVVTLISSILMRQVLRKNPQATAALRKSRLPLFFTLTMLGSQLTVRFLSDDSAERTLFYSTIVFILFIAIVVGIAWWALRVVRVVEAVVLEKYAGQGDLEDRRGRRLQTQVSLIRRILTAVIVTLAVARLLLTIPEVQALGAGILASAGVISVVAGLAMQSTLTNLFAGLQLAFTDSIRAGDVVMVEENFGSVEDITLSTVVLKSWDGRRFIYPSSYFVATPFENWTRVGTELLGTVELDVDWRVPSDALRARLKRLLDSTQLWDGRDYSLQLTEAIGGMVKARVVISAQNSGELWDLRCLVREDLVNYLRVEHPYAVLTRRMLVTNEEALSAGPERVNTGEFGSVTTPRAEEKFGEERPIAKEFSADSRGAETQSAQREIVESPVTESAEGGSMFTGSISAVQRNLDFAGPGEDAYRDRRERHEELSGEEPTDQPGYSTKEDTSDDDETTVIERPSSS